MPLVDFTSPAWTERDVPGDITVTANKQDVSTMEREADSCVHYDYDADHFTTFTHYIEGYWTANSAQQNYGGIWILSDVAGATEQDLNAANLGMSVYFRRNNSSVNLIAMMNRADNNSDTYTPSLGTLYYLTIERRTDPGNANDCKIYDDAPRTNLVDTIAVTYEAAAFRYLGCVHSSESAGANITYYVQDLDLNEAVAAAPTAALYGALTGPLGGPI